MPRPAPRRLIVNGRFLSGPRTAVNSVARDLTCALSAVPDGWDVTLAVPPSLADSATALGLPMRVHGHRAGIAWEQLEFPELAREGVLAGFFNTVPLRGRGHVTMLHDAQVFDAPESYGRATRLWRRLLSRRAARPGNHVLTISNYSRAALLRNDLGTPDRIAVVPNGLGAVSTVALDLAILSRLSLHAKGFCVGLATLLPHKNIRRLIEMFRDPRLSSIQLVLFGNASRDDFIAAGVTPGDNVTFAGFVSDAELAALYANALAALVPSLEEGFGLPALEAMSRGAAAFVADRAALPEVVGTNGLVLPATDMKAWADALLALQQDPARQQAMAEAGKRRASKFTWAAAAKTATGHLDRWYSRF